MERAGCAAENSQAVPGRMTKASFACAAPAGPGRQPDSRAASGPDLGVLRPLCEELADGPDTFTGTRKRGPELRQNRKGLPRAAAERREARGRAFPAVISGDPEMGPPRGGPRVRRVRTSACRRSAPLFLSSKLNWEWPPREAPPRRRTHVCSAAAHVRPEGADIEPA